MGGGHSEICELGQSLGSLAERVGASASHGGVALGSRGCATDLQMAVGERGSLQEAKEWTKAKVRTADRAEAPVL